GHEGLVPPGPAGGSCQGKYGLVCRLLALLRGLPERAVRGGMVLIARAVSISTCRQPGGAAPTARPLAEGAQPRDAATARDLPARCPGCSAGGRTTGRERRAAPVLYAGCADRLCAGILLAKGDCCACCHCHGARCFRRASPS